MHTTCHLRTYIFFNDLTSVGLKALVEYVNSTDTLRGVGPLDWPSCVWRRQQRTVNATVCVDAIGLLNSALTIHGQDVWRNRCEVLTIMVDGSSLAPASEGSSLRPREGEVGRRVRRAIRITSFSHGLSFGSRVAWRNLIHDRIRFAVTLIGISFAVVLMAVQFGLLIGLGQTAAGLVDHAKADFWVVSHGTSNVDQSVTIPERWRFDLLPVPGVLGVNQLLTRYAYWKLPDGRMQLVIVVGFDLADGVGGPWNVVEGSIEDLRAPNSVIVDKLYAQKLGIDRLSDTVEINGVRARIVGFTRGIRAFTQSPYIFTSVKNALRYGDLTDSQTNFLLVRVVPGADKAVVERGLRHALPATDILSSAEFSVMTSRYWLLTTGAGASLVVGALLGVVVGIIVVAQTLYAATVERLSEYATLLAIGAPAGYLNRIVLQQALVSGAFGYGIGIAIAVVIAAGSAGSSIALVLSWRLAAGVAVVTLAMCGTASIVAIRKIKNIDPTMVFR